MLNAPSIAYLTDTSGSSRARAIAQTESVRGIVTIASILTETVHSTWVSTEATTINPGVVTTVTVESQTSQIQPTQTPTIALQTTSQSEIPPSQSTNPESQPVQTQSLTVTPWLNTSTSRPIETSSSSPNPGSTMAALENTNSRTSERDVASPASDSADSQSSSATVTNVSVSSNSQITTAPISSYESSHFYTSTSSTSSASASAAVSKQFSDHSTNSSPHIATVVGSAVGGAAFVAVLLLACFLFFRRRRQRRGDSRRPSKQQLLSSQASTSSFGGSHIRQYSQPSLPVPQSSFIPSAPVFPGYRRASSPLNHRLHPAFAASNQELSIDRMYLREELEDRQIPGPSADPEKAPASPVIQISPPSHATSSVYSENSQDRALRQVLGYYANSSPGTPYESTYYAGDSTLTLPSLEPPMPHYLDSPQTRRSLRSDPFDLEPPEKALRKWPPLPPQPTPWGVKF